MNAPGSARGDDIRPEGDTADATAPPDAPTSDRSRDDVELLEVRAWPDPHLDLVGFEPGSRDFARFWTPLLGPAAAALYRFLVDAVRDEPHCDVDVVVAAEAIGLGRRKARLVVLPALERLQRHELLQVEMPYVAVRMTAPPLSPRLANRLPPRWRAELGI